MMKVSSKISFIKKALIVSSFLGIFSLVCIRQGNAQITFYNQYQPGFGDPYYFFGGVAPFGAFYSNSFYGYEYFGYSLPSRNAAVLSSSTLLAASLNIPATVPTTTTTVIGLNTAITLAALGGTGISSTTLAALAATPVPTLTTTPTIGTATALLLGGGVSASTLLLLGI